MMGPGCRAALHFSSDAVATEYPSGRPLVNSWNVLCELVECVPADGAVLRFGRVPRPAEAGRPR